MENSLGGKFLFVVNLSDDQRTRKHSELTGAYSSYVNI